VHLLFVLSVASRLVIADVDDGSYLDYEDEEDEDQQNMGAASPAAAGRET
jgi:hypothetical protein